MTLKCTFPSEDYHGVKMCVVLKETELCMRQTKVKSQDTVWHHASLLRDRESRRERETLCVSLLINMPCKQKSTY